MFMQQSFRNSHNESTNPAFKFQIVHLLQTLLAVGSRRRRVTVLAEPG
jgi:hypothetical protein